MSFLSVSKLPFASPHMLLGSFRRIRFTTPGLIFMAASPKTGVGGTWDLALSTITYLYVLYDMI